MITENEIRCGNWFHHNKNWSALQPKDDEFIEFDFQWDAACWGRLDECLLFFDYIEPIDLNESVLVKCGFEKWVSSHRRELYRIFINDEVCVSHDIYGISIEVGRNNFELRILNIKYLHQLQNFVYSTFGTELTYQPKT